MHPVHALTTPSFHALQDQLDDPCYFADRAYKQKIFQELVVFSSPCKHVESISDSFPCFYPVFQALALACSRAKSSTRLALSAKNHFCLMRLVMGSPMRSRDSSADTFVL